MKRLLCSLLVLVLSCSLLAQEASKHEARPVPDLAALKQMMSRLAPTQLRADVSQLSPGDQKALVKLIEAARVIDDIFLEQVWKSNEHTFRTLQPDKSPLGQARLRYFWINKSPWSELDGGTAFLPDVPEHRLPGANFYPEDMTKAEFEAWVKDLDPLLAEQARGFFSVIRRVIAVKETNGKKAGTSLEFAARPYRIEYRIHLQKAAALLREAAAATDNASLKKFLELRAEAFLSDDYYASDVAWMDLDAPLDVTIGPYETYLDELFGYKAAFEAYITLRDEQESKKLAVFSRHLQEIENNLPIPEKYRNPKLGGLAPIRVVNEIYASGDGNHGVQTAAYNLPNDERVVREKGSKKVMLKNVQEAKFNSVLVPISRQVLAAGEQPLADFESFFTHILAHELTHGIGPHQITLPDGSQTSPRLQLKELYSAIEEAKADVTGLFALQFLLDQGQLPGVSKQQAEEAERKLYTTFLASSFRTMRFGIHEAHGRGMAMQFNYLVEKGAFVPGEDGTFAVDFAKVKDGVRALTHDLLMLEAEGDYNGAKAMLERYARLTPEMERALAKLSDIPVDIEPLFVTANEVAPPPAKMPPGARP